MSSLLESLEAVLKKDGYGLEDIEFCIGMVGILGRGFAVRRLKPACFLEAASRIECGGGGSGIWNVDPSTAVIMRDGTRYYWIRSGGIEGWNARSDPRAGCRKPPAEFPPDEIFLMHPSPEGGTA